MLGDTHKILKAFSPYQCNVPTDFLIEWFFLVLVVFHNPYGKKFRGLSEDSEHCS